MLATVQKGHFQPQVFLGHAQVYAPHHHLLVMGQPLLTELQPWEGRQASKQHGQGHDKRVHRLPWEQRGGQGGCPGGGWGCGGGGTEDFPKEMTLEQSLEGRLGLK